MHTPDSSSPLQQQLINDIQTNGPLPFVDYMNYCLYAPGHGYYDAGREIFGRQGDFITAPELAGEQRLSLFAGAIANSVVEYAQSLSEYDLLEVGAGSGKLAEDLLLHLAKHNRLPKAYRILELSNSLKQRQQQRLSKLNLPVTIEWLDKPPKDPWNGILIGNEILDALPVERFCLDTNGLHRVGVTIEEHVLTECHLPPTLELSNAVTALQETLLKDHHINWPLPYTSEICLSLPEFIHDLTANLNDGHVLLVDYGYLRAEYYRPERHMGTLVCHHQHQGHFDLLDKPGEQDITAFVDFSMTGEAAEEAGLKVIDYQTQAHFLIHADIESVMAEAMLNADDNQAIQLAHEMKQLMLPTKMGEKFKVIVFQK